MIATSTIAKAGQWLDYQTLQAPVREPMRLLRGFFREQLDDFEPETRELAAYCLQHEGKRLRPLMLFYASTRNQVSDAIRQDQVRAAAVIEMVHQATLVHDDVLDDAKMRHQTDTPWAKWGRSTAVLLGDALFAQALQLASQFETVEVCRAVATATRQVCSGEIVQTFHRGQPRQHFAEYLRVIDLKTAELFRVAAHLGARLTGAETSLAERAGAVGRHLGMAYQMFDDLVDYSGSEAKIGKTLGTDLASGKLTMPVLFWLESLEEDEAILQEQRLLGGDFEVADLLPQLRASGALERSRARFLQELDMATELVEGLGREIPAMKRLMLLTRFIHQQVERLPSLAA